MLNAYTLPRACSKLKSDCPVMMRLWSRVWFPVSRRWRLPERASAQPYNCLRMRKWKEPPTLATLGHLFDTVIPSYPDIHTSYEPAQRHPSVPDIYTSHFYVAQYLPQARTLTILPLSFSGGNRDIPVPDRWILNLNSPLFQVSGRMNWHHGYAHTPTCFALADGS